MQVITVRHVTIYRYKQPVAFGEHRMMLRPRDSYDQKLLDAKLVITPEPADIRWVHDVFGNCVAIARFAGRAQELDIESVIRLDHSPTNALDFQIEEYARRYPFTYGADEMPDLLRAMERQYLDPEHELDQWARQFLRHDPRDQTEPDICQARGKRCPGSGEDLTAGQRQLPRFHGADDGGCALPRARRAFRIRLSLCSRRPPGRRRRHPRLASRLSAGSRLGRVRPDERHRRQPRSDPCGRGPRSAAGGAGLRHLDRLSVGFAWHDRRGRGDGRD